MLKICKTCGFEKELSEFVKQKSSYRSKCKLCRNISRRTGNLNIGRFKKGHASWNKKDVSKQSTRLKNWCLDIKTRDGWKCQRCGSDEKKKLCAHHIVRWKDDETKRFDLENGITYCHSCHFKVEGNNIAGWNKGIKGSVPGFKGQHTEETKKKISETMRKKYANYNQS